MNKIEKVINELIKELKNNNQINTEEISDGHHTFNELYDHRAKLFALIVNSNIDKSWKSKKHSDGTMFPHKEGKTPMFIVGITTPEGDCSYHYHMEYWDLFKCNELEYAPEYDGHKPSGIDRLFSL